MSFIYFLIDVLQNNPGASIALFALLLTFYQSYLTRKHNRLSVKPHLTVFSEFEYSNKIFTWNVTLTNCGLGPAIIDSYRVATDQFSTTSGDSIKMTSMILPK